MTCLCALLLGIGPAKFNLYDEYSDVRGMSAKAEFTCGRLWSGSIYETASWRGVNSPRLSAKFAKGEDGPIALAVNDLGDVIAHLNVGTRLSPTFVGYRWLHGSDMQRLKTFTDKDQSWPRAISRDGSQIAGTIFAVDNDWPVVWKRDGSIVRLPPTTRPKKYSGEALGISGNGQVIVGHLGSEATGPDAVTWTDLGAPRKLGNLPGGKVESYAWVASFDGSIVAGYSYDKSRAVPVRWVNGGKPTTLGSMPGQYQSGMARGISDDGSVIVGLWGFGESGQGFVWTARTGMVSATDFLRSRGLGADIKSLKLTSVMGISADGHTIAGECFDAEHRMHGYSATF